MMHDYSVLPIWMADFQHVPSLGFWRDTLASCAHASDAWSYHHTLGSLGVVFHQPVTLYCLWATDQPAHVALACSVDSGIEATVIHIGLGPVTLTQQLVVCKKATLNVAHVQQDARFSLRSILEQQEHSHSAIWDLNVHQHVLTTYLNEPFATTQQHIAHALYHHHQASIKTDVHHQASNTIAYQRHRSVMHDNSRLNTIGHIHIPQQVSQVVSHLKSQHWMCSNTAKVSAQPVLSVLSDDVVCTHGASITMPDPAAQLYAAARGLSNTHHILSAAFLYRLFSKAPCLLQQWFIRQTPLGRYVNP
jgi:SUF system FeS cluster assembly, SufBD